MASHDSINGQDKPILIISVRVIRTSKLLSILLLQYYTGDPFGRENVDVSSYLRHSMVTSNRGLYHASYIAKWHFQTTTYMRDTKSVWLFDRHPTREAFDNKLYCLKYQSTRKN